MPESTPIFDLPIPVEEDSPDGSAQIGALAEKVEAILAQIEQLLLGGPNPGDLLLVNGTSDPVYKAVTGDIAINSAGVTTIGNEKVTTAMVKNLAITAAKLADKGVETAKLADLAVTEAKLAALAVTAAKLAAEAVETGKIKNLAVTTAKIALLAVTEALIADGAVSTPKLADGAVTSRKYTPTSGIVRAGVEKGLVDGAAYVDVPNTELNVTPLVASKLLVLLCFDATASGVGGGTSGTISVDGADQGPIINWGNGGATESWQRQNGFQVYEVDLTAAKHTIKMRAKGTGGNLGVGANSSYWWRLAAS